MDNLFFDCNTNATLIFMMIFKNQHKKKMSTPQKNQNYQTACISSYLPAILKENKSGWIIEYYASHPVTQILTRKQIRLQRIVTRYKSAKDARVHVAKMIFILNTKLAGGWSPFFEDEDARLYEKIEDVAKLFIAEKKKELRENSLRSYSSFITILIDWVNVNNKGMYASMFTQIFAVRYMDHIYTGRNVGVTTYNNHIKMGRAFFNWLKERCYVKQNSFEMVKTKPKQKKTRIIIPLETRTKIIEDLQTKNSNFLIICKLIYNSLIRPNEIKLLTISDIHLDSNYIQVPATIAKNHNMRFAAINEDIVNSLKELNLERFPKSFYLFGSNLQPSKTRAGNGRYGEEWVKMKKRLKLPTEMQMYSLRDTGIYDMLKSGIDDLSVMQHADHSSLEMTTLYGNHFDENLIKNIISKAPKF